MTIHNLMNSMNVAPEVEIIVFNCTDDQIHYIGKYEDCTPAIYVREIESFNVDEVERFRSGNLYVTKVRIYAE